MAIDYFYYHLFDAIHYCIQRIIIIGNVHFAVRCLSLHVTIHSQRQMIVIIERKLKTCDSIDDEPITFPFIVPLNKLRRDYS